MSCAACARRVEKALGKVEGVRGARVDLVRERASIVIAAGAAPRAVGCRERGGARGLQAACA
jgi:Cu+-exporting ATPase